MYVIYGVYLDEAYYPATHDHEWIQDVVLELSDQPEPVWECTDCCWMVPGTVQE